jgi:hypothetical protein
MHATVGEQQRNFRSRAKLDATDELIGTAAFREGFDHREKITFPIFRHRYTKLRISQETSR